MKGTVKAVERGLHSYGMPAVAGTASISARSAWPVMAILAVMVAQAAMPALREFLLAISRQLGPAVGEVLSAAVRRRSPSPERPESQLDPSSIPESRLSISD
jgi:hypothetical protein